MPRQKKADAPPAMNPELWEVDRIKPYPKNARTHPDAQIELLASLIKRNGVDQPIVVDEDGVILKGHGRRLAALAIGLKQFPVVRRLGLTAAEKAAMRIEDNQVSLLSGWDNALLQVEISDLQTSGYPIHLLGFADHQLVKLGVSLDQAGATDPDAVVEPPKKPVSRLGDIWVMGDHRLMCGDSTDAECVAKLLDGTAPHLMVTDPPYGVEYDPGWRNDPGKLNLKSTTAFKGRKAASGKVMNDDRSDWTEAWKLFHGDVAYVWHGERQSPKIIGQFEVNGFSPRNLIVWAKNSLVISRGNYHPQHETCWYLVRDGKTANWSGDRTQSTLWSINRNLKNETGHGTQKPVECMKRPIENNSKKGDAVYEPFSGSGTTIMAAQLTGRRCLAMELSPAYVDVAVLRWQDFTGLEAMMDGKTFAQVAKERAKSGKAADKTPAAPRKSRARSLAPSHG